MLSTENAGKRQDDIDHRLQSAARAFHVNTWILCDKMVSMACRLKFCDAMITSVVCFAAGHRKIYTTQLRKFDVHWRKLLRCVVGPPADIDWNEPWHTRLHAWHRRINQQLEYHGFKMWALSLSGHCPNGGHNLMVLATILKTKGFRYWICALLMTSLFFFAKSYEEIGHVLDVLVDVLRQVGLVLNAGKTKILTTQSQHPAELVSPGGIVVEILRAGRKVRSYWAHTFCLLALNLKGCGV